MHDGYCLVGGEGEKERRRGAADDHTGTTNATTATAAANC